MQDVVHRHAVREKELACDVIELVVRFRWGHVLRVAETEESANLVRE